MHRKYLFEMSFTFATGVGSLVMFFTTHGSSLVTSRIQHIVFILIINYGGLNVFP